LDPVYELLAVIAWLATLKFFQLALYPPLKSTFGKSAYPIAYPAGFLLFGILSWYCGVFRIPLAVAVIPLAALFGWNLLNREFSFRDLSENVLSDFIFLIGFAFVLETRFINPVITTFSEGFMDHAFIASIMRTGIVPPPDPWFAPESLTMYYYYGHWLIGAPGAVLGIASQVVYNLALPTVFGLSFVTLYAIGEMYSSRFAWLSLGSILFLTPAVFYAAFTNPDGGLYAILDQARYPIPGTLVDYPLYPMWIGDVHANLIGVFNQLFLVFLLAFALLRWQGLDRRSGIILAVFTGISLGAVPAINSWDILLYVPLVLIAGVIIWWRWFFKAREGPSPLLLLPGVPLLAGVLYLPYHLSFKVTGVSGLGLVHSPTQAVPFLLAAGFFVLFYTVHGLDRMKERPWLIVCVIPFLFGGYPAVGLALLPLIYLVERRDWSVPCLLAIAGFSLIIFVEFFHLNEALSGDNERFNTILKVYFSVLIVLALSASLIAAQWLDRQPPLLTHRSRKIAAVAAVLMFLAVPAVLQIDIGKGLLGISYPSGYFTLDGIAYVDSVSPGDADAIRFLRSRNMNDTVVEAFGGDYSYYSRISSFTGLPTILGQLNAHEFGWRGDTDGWYWYRQDDIADIYQNPEKALSLMDKYHANLLYVGDAEREKYNVSLPENGLTGIYNEKGVQIYERIPGSPEAGTDRGDVSRVIETPGEYELNRDLVVTGEEPGLEIRTSDVVIKGNGHRIVSGSDTWGTGTGVAVYIPSGVVANVTLEDLRITGFKTGLYVVNAEKIHLEDTDVQDNTEGVALTFCQEVYVENSVIHGSEFGLLLEGTGHSVVTGNRVEQNRIGLTLRDAVGNHVYNNVFSNDRNVFEEGIVMNIWNATPSSGLNIAGGPVTGGNLWLFPDKQPILQGCTDDDADGLCDEPFRISDNSTDMHPLVESPRKVLTY
jgi:YYY domain-containing protein